MNIKSISTNRKRSAVIQTQNTFAVQRANKPGQWTTVARNSRSLVAYALVGRFKRDDRPVRVVNEDTGKMPLPPQIVKLVSWMWIRGFSEPAIDAACSHVHAVEAQSNLKAAS